MEHKVFVLKFSSTPGYPGNFNFVPGISRQIADRQPRTIPTKDLFGGVVCELLEPKRTATYAPPLFRTRDVDRRFCGGGAWTSRSANSFPRFQGHAKLVGPQRIHVEDPHPTRRYPDPKVWLCASSCLRVGSNSKFGFTTLHGFCLWVKGRSPRVGTPIRGPPGKQDLLGASESSRPVHMHKLVNEFLLIFLQGNSAESLQDFSDPQNIPDNPYPLTKGGGGSPRSFGGWSV